MNNLERNSVIDKSELSDEFYFQSLLAQAHSKGTLADSDVERLQCESLNLLAEKVTRFNAGESSSIRIEKAQSMMASILFTIGLWLKTHQNPDDAVAALQNEQMAGLYQKGRKRINTMLVATKVIHAKMLGRLMDTKNVYYRSTIEGGIHGFFKLYDPDFGAHEIHITADYPAFNPMPRLAGIEFIHAYLSALYYENQFCLYFDPDDIHHLLCGYEKGYQELLMNIYEIVLTAAIGCVLLNVDAHRLDISEGGAARLNRMFDGMTKREILATIQKAAHELTRMFACSNGLERYIQSSLPLIAGKIEVAAREQLLDRVFPVPAYPEREPRLLFSFGNKMEDEQYRKVVEEITQCQSSQEKLAIIKEAIRSLADLEDVLLDAGLTQAETRAVLRGLSLPEIIALSKKYGVMSGVEAIEYREQEQKVRKCLHDYISELPDEQRQLLVKASGAMDIHTNPKV